MLWCGAFGPVDWSDAGGGEINSQNPAFRCDDPDLPWDEFPAVFQCLHCRTLQTAAARYLHPGNGEAFDVVVCQNGGQLFRIIPFIQLWTANEGDMVPDKILMEISICVCSAVCSDQQVGVLIIRRLLRYQFDLDRPLRELSRTGRRRRLLWNTGAAGDAFCHASL